MFSVQSALLGALLVGLAAPANSDMELQLLQMVFRHGDKVPHREFQNYPNDPYRDHSYYPLGNGDLTNEGKMREYKIGTMLRERYDQYFGPDYWPAKIYARSTVVPRTQLSLQLVLAGLFPPSERQTWNPHLPWIPAWTFFAPIEADNLLFSHYCHWYKEEYRRFLQLDSTQKMVNKYRSVMDYLTDHTGKLIDSTGAVSHLYNLLKEEAAQNLTLPRWTENVYPNPLRDIIELDFKLQSYTKTLKRLNGGILLRKMVEDIQEHRAGKSPSDRKAFLFGCHEINVAAVANALGMDEPAIPEYGSAIILETHRDNMKAYYVRVLLWTGVTEQLIVKTIPGCAEFCPFEEFFGIIKDVLPNDDEYYCRKNKTTNDTKMNTHYRSSAASVADDRIWRHIFLAVLLAFTSKFVQK